MIFNPFQLVHESPVVPAKSDIGVMFCLQTYQGLTDLPNALKRESIYNIDMLF